MAVAVTAAAGGAAKADPPGLQPRPLAEGREPDPVARDHFLPDAPAVSAVPLAPAADGPHAFWLALVAAHEALADALTMPLGTARIADM